MLTIRKFLLVTVGLVAFVLDSPAGASELDSQMEKMVKRISDSAISQGISTATIAVFPFRADKYLSKKRVNFAVSETLTYKFMKASIFRLVERNRLEDILKEQKLGLNGVIDSGTAAQIGRLVGAKLLALGDVSRIASSYQISVKLVDSESSEIMASEIIEVPVKILDEDASRYLVLVPEQEVLGIYILNQTSFVNIPSTEQTVSKGVLFNFKTESVNTSAQNWGLGVRYFPIHWLFMDFSYMPQSSMQKMKLRLDFYGDYSGVQNFEFGVTQGPVYSGSINGVCNYSNKIKFFTGLGISKVSFKVDYPLLSHGYQAQMGAVGYYLANQYQKGGVSTNLDLKLVSLSGGVEWRPQQRFGLAYSVSHYWGSLPKLQLFFHANSGTDFSTDILEFEIPSITHRIMASFYF